MYIKELTNQEFNEFTKNYSIKSIYQTCEYAFAMNEENFDSVFIGLIDNDEIIAASLFLIEQKGNLKYAYVPKGFLIDYTDYKLLETFTLLIKKYFSKLNIVGIKICPKISKEDVIYEEAFKNLKKLKYKHLGYNNFFEGLKPRYEAILNIEKPYYILFKNIKKNFKTKIRNAEKIGISIHKGNITHLEHLYSHTKKKYPRELTYYINICNFYKSKAEIYFAKLDTYKYLTLAISNVQNQEEICNNLNKELKTNKSVLNKKMRNDLLLNKYKEDLIKANKLISENPDGIILSSCLIIKNNKEIYLLMDGYDKKYKRFNSKHILIWKIIEKYSNLKYKKFNLGGITNPDEQIKKYKGLNEFKLSFNSDIVEYIGDFELIINKPLYLMYKNKKS